MKTNDRNLKIYILKTQLKLTTEDKPVTVTQFYFIRHTPLYQTGIIRYVSRAFLSAWAFTNTWLYKSNSISRAISGISAAANY